MVQSTFIYCSHSAYDYTRLCRLRSKPAGDWISGDERYTEYMHIFFSGIGGTGIGPLALVARQAGYDVSGSDKQDSLYIDYAKKHGIEHITIGQTYDDIAAAHARAPIDWYVYSSAVAIERPDAPEFAFCREHGVRMSKRDELLNQILHDKQLPLVAVAGTHGKTTTTAMAVWLAKQLKLPLGYILPAKSSFAEMGAYEDGAQLFVYECDEFDRNFLHYRPQHSLISGVDWDHPDIYPTRQSYYDAFREFIAASAYTTLWLSDSKRLGLQPSDTCQILDDNDPLMQAIRLPGEVNRRNSWLVACAFHALTKRPTAELVTLLESFPGVSRRFEPIAPGLYSDYAHTPAKIRGALQLGREVAGNNLVVVYEGLHNTRQHFIKDELRSLFDGVKQLYIVPSYLARENTSLELLTPDKLRLIVSPATQKVTRPAALDARLRQQIASHLAAGDTVLCLTAGGGNSLDEWLRQTFPS